MIKHTIFARSNTCLSDQQNACLLSYNIMEEGLVKILLDQDDQETHFVRSYVFLLDHMIGDRPYK